jgi:hypothetical protein
MESVVVMLSPLRSPGSWALLMVGLFGCPPSTSGSGAPPGPQAGSARPEASAPVEARSATIAVPSSAPSIVALALSQIRQRQAEDLAT